MFERSNWSTVSPTSARAMAVIGKTMAMTGTVEFDQKRRPRLYAAYLEHCHFRCESTLQETRGGSRHVDVQSLDSGIRDGSQRALYASRQGRRPMLKRRGR